MNSTRAYVCFEHQWDDPQSETTYCVACGLSRPQHLAWETDRQTIKTLKRALSLAVRMEPRLLARSMIKKAVERIIAEQKAEKLDA